MDAQFRRHGRSPTAWFAFATLLVLAAAGCQPSPSSAPVTSPTQTSVERVADPSGDEGELLDSAWEALYLHGAKVGYGRTERRRIGDRLVTRSEQIPLIQRYKQQTEQTISFQSESSSEGGLLALQLNMRAGNMALESYGNVKDGMLKLTTITQGKRSTSSIPWDDEQRGYFGLEDSLRENPMQPGETRRVQWLQPLIHEVSDEHLEGLEKGEVDLIGEKKILLKIRSIARLAGRKTETLLWTDDQGIVWRSSRPAQGLESYRTSEKIAKAPPDKSFDLGLSTIVKLDAPLEAPHETRRVVYRATLKHGNPADEFPQGETQSVRSLGEHAAEITVVRVTAEQPAEPLVRTAEPTASDKGSNNFIQSDDPAVKQMAEEIAGRESDSVAIALALEQGVHERLKNKNFSQAFSTAADVARTLEGDCTEHAVLLAALCRSKGIPARIAAGLVYYPPKQGFAYHMWTEAWLNDRWVPFDATLGRGGIGGGHLKLFDSNLDGVGAFAAFLPVMNVLGQLELDVVEVE